MSNNKQTKTTARGKGVRIGKGSGFYYSKKGKINPKKRILISPRIKDSELDELSQELRLKVWKLITSDRYKFCSLIVLHGLELKMGDLGFNLEKQSSFCIDRCHFDGRKQGGGKIEG